MTRTFELRGFRDIPVDPDTVLRSMIGIPLPLLFRRGYGLIAPVKRVHDEPESWGQVGQQRTVELAAFSGSFRERLVEVAPPGLFRYELTQVTGPLGLLMQSVQGQWTFAPSGTGTRVVWQWSVQPTSGIARLLRPVVAWMWAGFARQALEELSSYLLDAAPTHEQLPEGKDADHGFFAYLDELDAKRRRG